MDQPPSTRPIPLQGNIYSLTETVRERAILAISFAEDFERLLELYQIMDYDIYVKSGSFTLSHSRREQPPSPPALETEKEPSNSNTTPANEEDFFFDLKS